MTYYKVLKRHPGKTRQIEIKNFWPVKVSFCRFCVVFCVKTNCITFKLLNILFAVSGSNRDQKENNLYKKCILSQKIFASPEFNTN